MAKTSIKNKSPKRMKSPTRVKRKSKKRQKETKVSHISGTSWLAQMKLTTLSQKILQTRPSLWQNTRCMANHDSEKK